MAEIAPTTSVEAALGEGTSEEKAPMTWYVITTSKGFIWIVAAATHETAIAKLKAKMPSVEIAMCVAAWGFIPE